MLDIETTGRHRSSAMGIRALAMLSTWFLLSGCSEELAKATPPAVGKPAEVTVDVEAGTELELWHDLDFKEKGRDRSEGCLTWHVAVSQGGTEIATKTCKAAWSDAPCKGGTVNGGFSHDWTNCEVRDCAIVVKKGGKTTVRAKLENRCGYQVKSHAFRVNRG
jgi:hypothetical protein